MNVQSLKPFLFLFLLAGWLSANGQAQHKIDSLSQVLNQHPGHDTTRASLLNQIGYEYWTINPLQAEKYGKEAAALSKEIDYQKGLAMADRVIGVSYWSRGDFLNALSHLLNSQKIYRDLRDPLGEANSTMNIGLVHADQKDHVRALQNFNQAIQLFQKLGKEDRIGITYNKVGTVYLERGNLEKSKYFLTKALEIHTKYNSGFGIMEASNRMGLLCRELKQYDSAIYYLNHSLELAEKNNDREHEVKNLENLASVYILKKQFNVAKELLDKAYSLALAHQYRKWLRDILKDYKDIYSARNEYAKALDYTIRYEAIKDSIFGEEKTAQIANLELEYQQAQQQQALKFQRQQIQLLQQQTRLDRLINILLVSGIIVMVTIAYLFFRYQRLRFNQRQQVHEQEVQLSKVELENARLREAELTQSLEFKNKELTSYTMNFIRKNEMIEKLKEQLDSLKSSLPNQSKEISSLYSLINQARGVDRDWEDFKRTFENVHHNFFGRLLEKYPDLTQSELRLCALICLNLSIKEMASLMGISPDSVKTARYRLRKRFDLATEQNLADFVIGFS